MNLSFKSSENCGLTHGIVQYGIVIVLSFLCLIVPVVSDETPQFSVPDGNWVVEQYRSSNGDLISPLSDAPISALFSSENLTGMVGCNTYSAQYTAASGAMIIPGPVVTLNDCPSLVKIQEKDYLQDLKDTAFFQVQNSRLLLSDDDEELLVSLTHKK